MHIGQASIFLAEVMRRPASTSKNMSSGLRMHGYLRTGARGRHAPHLTSDELSHLLIGYLVAPDSPALALRKVPHFASLPIDSDANPYMTFAPALALLLDRLSKEDAEKAKACDWEVAVALDISCASIREYVDGVEMVHFFSSLARPVSDTEFRDDLPYASPLRETRSMSWITLYRVARVVLAKQPDPIDEILTIRERERAEA